MHLSRHRVAYIRSTSASHEAGNRTPAHVGVAFVTARSYGKDLHLSSTARCVYISTFTKLENVSVTRRCDATCLQEVVTFSAFAFGLLSTNDVLSGTRKLLSQKKLARFAYDLLANARRCNLPALVPLIIRVLRLPRTLKIDALDQARSRSTHVLGLMCFR
jgi:hypothetical protein